MCLRAALFVPPTNGRMEPKDAVSRDEMSPVLITLGGFMNLVGALPELHGTSCQRKPTLLSSESPLNCNDALPQVQLALG